jgi:hypothetical protein
MYVLGSYQERFVWLTPALLAHFKGNVLQKIRRDKNGNNQLVLL